jgi:hypothetical protein
MGLLSSISGAVKSVQKAIAIAPTPKSATVQSIKAVGAAVTKPAVIFAAAVTSPVSYVKDPVKTVEKFVAQPIVTQVVKGAAAGIALGAFAAPVQAIPKIIAAASTTAGKVALVGGTAAVIAPQTTNLVMTNPDLRDVAIGTAVGGGTLGGIVALEKGGSIITAALEEYAPEIKTALIGAGLGAAVTGLAAGGIYALTKKDDEAIPTLDTGLGTAMLPRETSTISTGTPKKRYKARTTQKALRVSQSVRIHINNRSQASTSKRFINYRR